MEKLNFLILKIEFKLSNWTWEIFVYVYVHVHLFLRDFEKLTKDVEETKEKFAEFEKQDVKCREDLKHAKGKTKKLDKTLEQEKKRVSDKWQVMGIIGVGMNL